MTTFVSPPLPIETESMQGKIANAVSLWNYQENSGTWISYHDSFVKLGPVDVRRLTYVEQRELRYIAINLLKHSGLGITINLPKDFPVFGTSLSSVVEKEWDSMDRLELDSECLMYELDNRRYSTSFSGIFGDENSHKNSHPRSFFIEALSLNNFQDNTEKESSKEYEMVHVPNLINKCCKFIIEKGLYTEGIFRIPASKKRILELKEQINYSGQVVFDENTNVHEVAGLIKEYLRELPEPLLTKELYEAFLSISKLFHREQIRALQLLINVLPGYNRDTLYTLLAFLNLIHSKSKCAIDHMTGHQIIGNKMDSKNLAIVFAPNILRKSTKDGSCSKEKSDMASDIVKVMIDEYEEIFRVSSKLHNETVKAIAANTPEFLDLVIFYKIQHGCGLFSCRLDPHDKSVLEGMDLRPLFERYSHLSVKSTQLYNIPLMAQRSLTYIGRNAQVPTPLLTKTNPLNMDIKNNMESNSNEQTNQETSSSSTVPFKKYIRSKTAPLKQLKRFLTQSSPHISKEHNNFTLDTKQKFSSTLQIYEKT